MDPAGYLDDLAADGALLATAARRAGVEAVVPACPGWQVSDLLVHTAKVFRHKTHVLVHGLTERPSGSDWNVDDPAPVDAPAFYDAELGALLAALGSSDPAQRVWTFVPGDQTVAFWYRRMAHEAAIHRVDAEAAGGAPGAVRPELAVDGLDEALDLFLAARLGAGTLDGPEATVHLHATDAVGEWLVHLGPDGLDVERGHAKGDTAARGTASDLLLWLWGRMPVVRLEVFGDADALDRLRAAAATVT